QPPSVRGAIIFIDGSVKANAARQAELRHEAEAALEEARQALDDKSFAQVVMKRSADQATRYRGGDMGWVTPGMAGVDPALTQALLALEKPGQFAPLVETARGF